MNHLDERRWVIRVVRARSPLSETALGVLARAARTGVGFERKGSGLRFAGKGRNRRSWASDGGLRMCREKEVFVLEAALALTGVDAS